MAGEADGSRDGDGGAAPRGAIDGAGVANPSHPAAAAAMDDGSNALVTGAASSSINPDVPPKQSTKPAPAPSGIITQGEAILKLSGGAHLTSHGVGYQVDNTNTVTYDKAVVIAGTGAFTELIQEMQVEGVQDLMSARLLL